MRPWLPRLWHSFVCQQISCYCLVVSAVISADGILV